MRWIILKKSKYSIIIVMIMLFSVILLMGLTKKKVGVHVDEYLTYGLANAHDEVLDTWKFVPQYGVRMSAEEVFSDYFYADVFNVGNVWKNQEQDTHPPFYYLLVHVFTLISHHFLAIKTAVLLNIIFHMINISLVWLILKEMLSEKYLGILGSAWYAFLPIALGNVLFIRMYAMLTLFILLVTLLFVRNWDMIKDKHFYGCLLLVSVGGALTHYYFLLYLFFCCLIWGGQIIRKRAYRELISFMGAMVSAGIVSIAIFPNMLKHIFVGDVGKRTTDFSGSVIDLLKNLKAFGSAIDSVYGGFLIVVLIAVLGMNIYMFSEWTGRKGEIRRDAIIVVPGICFFLVVTKVAIMPTTRYISGIYGICIIAFMVWTDKVVNSFNVKKEIQVTIITILIGVMLNGSWKTYEWPELHLEAEEYLDIAETLGENNECICIQKTSWHTLFNYQEYIKYQAITFIDDDDIESLWGAERTHYDSVVIYYDMYIDQEIVEDSLQKMIEANEGLHAYEKLYEYGYNVVYYLE